MAQKIALLVLRYGLGLFLLLWGVDKFIDPEGTVKIFQVFYKTTVGTNAAYVFGTLEIILAIAILAGLWRTYTYGLGMVLHGISTVSSWRQMLPFTDAYNHLFLAGLPVLAGFIALFLMRRKDTKWTL